MPSTKWRALYGTFMRRQQMFNTIQEVFHVYLNKFENAVSHLFLVIFGNN